MPVMCIQCSLEAMVLGKPAPVFEETMQEHIERAHPDPHVANRRRRELEQLLMDQTIVPKPGEPT